MEKLRKIFNKCPFCHQDMIVEKQQDLWTEYYCKQHEGDHTFIQQVYDDQVMKIIIRLGTGNTRKYLRVNYLNGTSQVWIGRFNSQGQVDIDHIIDVDPYDQESIIKKIKTYVTFQ